MVKSKSNKKADKSTKTKDDLFGYIKLGRLNSTIAKQIKRKPADIFINNAHLRHIKNKHQFELNINDNSEALQYVRGVVKNFNMIFGGKDEALLLIHNQPKRADIAVIELVPINPKLNIYQVKSAYIKDKKWVANNTTLLWFK